MKVLDVIVGASRRAGGPPPFVGGGALVLGKLGVDVEILSTDLGRAPWGWFQSQHRVRQEELEPTLAEANLRLYRARFPRRLGFSPALYRAAKRRARGADVIHIHNLWQFPQYAGYASAKATSVPYIVSPHGSLDPFLRQKGRLRKRLVSGLWQDDMFNDAALIHVTTAAEERLIEDVAPRVPRVVVPCGIHVSEFSRLPPRAAFREARLDGYQGPLILFLGRVTQKKRVDLLIRAFATVRRRCESRLAIVGPDDEGLLPTLTALVAELGLTRDVAFLGPAYDEERLAALASADVWALPSHAENFGIAVVEAMAAGCPVVISPGVNLAEDVEAAGAGLVAELNPQVFGRALYALLDDHRRREEIRKTARAFASRYDWSVVGPQLLSMYRTVA